MSAKKEDGLILGRNEGILEGIGGRATICNGNFSVAFIIVEQQLQTQNGEQASSPQLSECWSWSEKRPCSSPEICLSNSIIPPPPSPQGTNASANMYKVNIWITNFISCKNININCAMQLHNR